MWPRTGRWRIIRISGRPRNRDACGAVRTRPHVNPEHPGGIANNAVLAESARPEVIAACLLLWIPRDVSSLRAQRDTKLREARDARAWMTSFRQFAETGPTASHFTYEGTPSGFQPFGLEATVKYFLHSLDVTTVPLNSPEGLKLYEDHKAPILRWNEQMHELRIETP